MSAKNSGPRVKRDKLEVLTSPDASDPVLVESTSTPDEQEAAAQLAADFDAIRDRALASWHDVTVEVLGDTSADPSAEEDAEGVASAEPSGSTETT